MTDYPRLNLPALSIRQPWAWLVCSGHKRIENREWVHGPKYRGDILIHAATTRDPGIEGMDWLKERIGFIPDASVYAHKGGIVGMAKVVDVVRHSSDPWYIPGSWGLVLENAQFLPFAPVIGQQRFFRVIYQQTGENEAKAFRPLKQQHRRQR